MAGGMKRLVKETAVYGLSSIVGRFLNWLLVPMYTRVLSTTGDYGIVTNLYGWTALLLILLTYGMETGFFRFINKKEEGEPMRIYGSVLRCLLFTSSLFFILVLLFASPVSHVLGYDKNPEYLVIMGGIVALDAFTRVPFAYLRYKGMAWRFAGINFVSIGLNIGLNIFFLILCPWLYKVEPASVEWFYIPGYDVGYVFVANAITSAANLLMLMPYVVQGLKARYNPAVLKEILRYSFPILILGIAGVFNQTADKILFPFLFEDKAYANDQLGIYGACFKIAAVMLMFTQAFRYAYEPFAFSRNKGTDNRQSYSDAMKYFIIFSLFIFLGVMFYMDILKHLVIESYYPGLRVVPIVMLGELFFGIYFNLSFWYKLIDQTWWGAYFSAIGCVVTVSIILVFAPTYGYMACAWASFACNLLMMLLSYFVGQKKYPVRYDLRSVSLYSVLAGGLFAAGMLPEIPSVLLRLFYRSALLLVFVCVVVWRDLPLAGLPYIGKCFSRNK